MGLKKKTAAIIQARYSSTRFPGKILSKIHNKTLLEILILRLKQSKKIDEIIVACTKNKKDKKIISICKKLKVSYFVGSENNVLERYFKAAKKFNVSNIVRITSDCPLVEYRIVDKLIINYHNSKSQYASNVINPTYPDGIDVEIINFDLIKNRYFSTKNTFEKEHVTTEIIKNIKYKKFSLENKKNYSNLRLTVDTKYDLEIIKKLFKHFKYDFKISFEKIINLYKKNQKFFGYNSHTTRNVGMELNLGQKYWIRANNIIPGGTMLFTKNPDLILPKFWPAYFSKSKGCKIFDLDRKMYDDLCLMGVGTNTLGYSYKPVLKEVMKVINGGNMTSLNSIDEIHLAEKLIDLHPWAEMARFTRTGGEANAVAIRIARAYTGKDNVAICGYHGWHDWYLSTNIKNNNNLNNHLMQNLPIAGVPKNLSNTVFSFDYNNINQLKKLIDKKNIGVVKMEVERNTVPKNNFIKKVRDLTKKKNIILIFDECTSGFRANYGGIHMKYKVFPDMAIFGKALGNGHAINAILGKKDIMLATKNTFISSTFWTERTGSAAALATLNSMNKLKSWEIISSLGVIIKKNWKKLAQKHGLKLVVQGLDAIPNFYFKSKYNIEYKTFISQEMLKDNILASNVVFVCIFHNRKLLQRYFYNLDKIFKKIQNCENQVENIYNLLDYKKSLTGFRENVNK